MAQPRTPLLVDLTLAEYVDKVGGSTAAPAGGSVTACGGALAAALAEMVAGLTVGREKYASSQETMMEVLAQASRLRKQLLALVDADATAFMAVMNAYALPKDTPEQEAERERAIQESLRHAVDIPLATAEACVQVLHLAALAAQYGNRNAVSDAGVGALFANAALQGAVRNVRFNLRGVKDGDFQRAAEARVTGLLTTGEGALRRALSA